MKRRSFFARLLAGVTTLGAVPVAAQSLTVKLSDLDDFPTPEPYPANLAFASVMPICPRCGSVLMTDWPPGLVELNPLAPLPVKCLNNSVYPDYRRCGWSGVAPRAMRIPQ